MDRRNFLNSLSVIPSVIARLLDQGLDLEAKITRLRQSPDPWERIGFRVELVV
ncbi:MAG: hypothetical protein HY787_21850 [Deltaproteobacteria bacterium]|nr:hypothetical protein [Deltaproteobacteria bacterium]